MAKTQAEQQPAPALPRQRFHSYPFWAPRFWHGMRLGDYLKLLVRNRLAIHPLRWPMALAIALVASLNSLLRLVQRAVYGRRLARTTIEHAPIFIIGHWRSGTTWLHELFMLDDQFATPTTRQCFTPHHFLVSSWLLGWVRYLLPARRPMDNVAAGWDRPQEDEFALVALGVPSPYLTMAFPNRPPQYANYLDMQGLSHVELERWKRALRSFLTAVTLKQPKPIVLKSPPHTGRIRVLLEMFPDARFVHIVRDPHVVVPSTIRLWQSLYAAQGFQLPRCEGLDEHVFASFERMYAALSRDRRRIDPGRIVDVHYENLAADPVGQMEQIYRRLNLPEFDRLRPRLEEAASRQSEYRTNKYELSDELRGEIAARLGDYLAQYGYEPQPVAATCTATEHP